jgi:hypothetical protein
MLPDISNDPATTSPLNVPVSKSTALEITSAGFFPMYGIM